MAEKPGSGPRGVVRGLERVGVKTRIALRWIRKFMKTWTVGIWKFWNRKDI